tara:strand:- start:174 stop:413 length:240 start_codon:yes stop_codon:yes gene_type:complete
MINEGLLEYGLAGIIISVLLYAVRVLFNRIEKIQKDHQDTVENILVAHQTERKEWYDDVKEMVNDLKVTMEIIRGSIKK